MYRINLKGKTFGRLKVMKYIQGRTNISRSMWKCRCKCGNTCIVQVGNLTSGNTISCGCFRSEYISAKNKVELHVKHGLHKSKEYTAFHSMHQRCENPKYTYYNRYGGKTPPVQVCARWSTFEQFFEDMGYAPSAEHSLGRILDRGDYENGNVFWMTDAEQGLASQNNHALARWEAQNQEKNNELSN